MKWGSVSARSKWFPAFFLLLLALMLGCLYNGSMGYFNLLISLLPTFCGVFVAVFVSYFIYYLAWFQPPLGAGARHFQDKRYEEAARSFRLLLSRRPPAGMEADARRRLADTLDVLGRPDEAAAEREKAGNAAMKAAKDPTALAAQGDLLTHQGRHNEACPFFERAIAQTPNLPGGGRAHFMAKLALAHQQAGRSGEALHWARTSLASGPTKDIRRLMESIAGVASADQGDLEGAEGHYRRALELAQASGKPEEIARAMTILAGLQYKRGQFAEAITASRQARQVFADPAKISYAIEAECLRDTGRFDEARAVMEQRRQAPGFDQPWTERKTQALGALGSAWIELYSEQYAAALPYLEAAREGLKSASTPPAGVWPPPVAAGAEDKIMLWCDATQAAVLAGVGRGAEARALMESVERRLPEFSGDRATLLGTYGSLGRAAFLLGDYVLSRKFWQDYLGCQPNPASQPTAHYWLGEIMLRVGERAAAREEFQQAVAPGFDSYSVQKARARLEEPGG